MHFDKHRFGIGLLIALGAVFATAGSAVAGNYPDITQSKSNIGYSLPVGEAVGQSFTAVGTGRITAIGISSNGGSFDVLVYAGAGAGGTLLYSEQGVFFANTTPGVSDVHTLQTPISVVMNHVYTFKIINKSSAQFGRRIVHSSNDGSDAYAGGRRYTFGGPDESAAADMAFVVKSAQ